MNDATRQLIEHKQRAADLCRARELISQAWTLCQGADVNVDVQAEALKTAVRQALKDIGWSGEDSEWDFRAAIMRHRREAKL